MSNKPSLCWISMFAHRVLVELKYNEGGWGALLGDRHLHLVPLCCNTRGLLWPWGNQHRRNTIQSELLSVPKAKHAFGGGTVIHSAHRKWTIYMNYVTLTVEGPFQRRYVLQFKHLVWLLALLQKGQYELNITAGSKAFIWRGKIQIDWFPATGSVGCFLLLFLPKAGQKSLLSTN